MAMLIGGLLLVAAVLVSAVVDQLIPRVSLPIVQVALGIVMALLVPSLGEIELDPNLFMVMLIAPLLYDEAKNTDKASLWHNRGSVISLAVGLVVATVLVVGFATHMLVPAIPLAAACALGAALAPTDAVAVSSLSDEVDIPDKQKSILNSEAMLNDASGVVAFQFALAAAVAGTFSLADATVSFLVQFFGGVALGAVLGYACRLILRGVQAIGVSNTTFYVLFELLVPFLVYLIASSFNVSAIIAVVTAGLLDVTSQRRIEPAVSHMNIVSSSVWRVLTFALNGIVFVLLGMELPGIMGRMWEDLSISNITLMCYVLALTVLLYATRFLWALGMEVHRVRIVQKRALGKSDVKSALVSTLCGAKGTITLAVLFTIPVLMPSGEPFPQRDLIIFLAAGVIVCTLLVATFVVPLFAPARDLKQAEVDRMKHETQCAVDIASSVIARLSSRQTPENSVETNTVIMSYQERIKSLREEGDVSGQAASELSLEAIQRERDCVVRLVEKGEASPEVGRRYLEHLNLLEKTKRDRTHRTSLAVKLKRSARSIRQIVRVVLRRHHAHDEAAMQLREVRYAAHDCVVEWLEGIVAKGGADAPEASVLLAEYRSLRDVDPVRHDPSVTNALKAEDKVRDVQRLGCEMELEEIQERYEDGTLSRETANRMRESVYLVRLDLDDGV